MSKQGVSKSQQSLADRYVTVGQASKHLGISIDTIRRWERAGKLQAHRLDGKNRHFLITDLEQFKAARPLSTLQVAEQLGLSASSVRRLEDQGVLVPRRDSNGKRLYDADQVTHYIKQREQQRHQPGDLRNAAPLAADEVAPAPAVQQPARRPRYPRRPRQPMHHVSLAPIWQFIRGRESKRIGVATLAGGLASMAVFLLASPWQTGTQPVAYRANEKRVALATDFMKTTGNESKVAALQLPSTFFVELPKHGLIVTLTSDGLKGQPVDLSTFAAKPVTSGQTATGGVSFDNLAPELQALIGAGGGGGGISNASNTYITNVHQTNATSVVAGLGLSGTSNNNVLTLNVNTGSTIELVSNNLEVRLGGMATSTTSSASGLEAAGSGLQLVGGCGVGQVLQWTGGAWACATIGSGSSDLAVKEGGITVTPNATAVNFASSDFIITNNAGGADVAIDYGNSGLTRAGVAQTITGNWSFRDSGLVITDNIDPTKQVNFQVSGVASGTTRTLTVPNADGTLVTTGNLANITAVGTVTSGSWQGSAVGVQYGGTGAASFTNGGILYGNGTGTLQATAAGTGGQLVVASAGGAPSFVSLSGDATLSALGALTLANTGTATGTFGDTTHTPTVVVDAKGRITGISSSLITGTAPGGAAGGDLTGNYPGPTIGRLQGNTLTIGSLSAGQMLLYNGSAFVNQSLSGDITLSGAGAATIQAGTVTNAKLANSSLTVTAGTGLSGGGSISLGGSTTLNLASTTVTANSYGSSTAVPTFTVDAEGRLTAAGSTTLANSALQNSSITINNGTNITGGGAVSLGGSLTLGTAAASTFGTSVTTPLLTNAGQLTVSSTGAGNDIVLNSADQIILNGFAAGVVRTNASGVLSSSVVVLGADTSGNYVANLGTLTGLTTTGNGGAGSTPTLAVSYGAAANTAAQGNTVLSFTGAGNLTGTVSGTAGGGFTSNTLAVVGNPTFSGLVTADGGLAVNGQTVITSGRMLQNVTADTSILTSGTLGTNRGGTGLNSFTANGIIYASTSSALAQAAGTTGQVLLANSSGVPTFTTLGGDVGSITGTGALTIANDAITTAKILNANVTNAKLANSSLTVTAGTGLSGGGTVSLGGSTALNLADTTVSANSYGSSAAVPTFTVDAQGRLTAAGTTTLANGALQNSSITINNGTNITGGGTVSLGGSLTIGTAAASTFGTSVTTPLIQNAGTITLDTTATGGADDILFSTAGSEVLRILENGDLRFEKGANDVTFAMATPGAAATYTFSGATGTVLTSANYTTSLDATYINTNESPAAGDISGSFSGGLTVVADSIALSTDTTGNYVRDVTAGNGLTGDVASEGGTANLAVGAGNGISVAADSIAVSVQGNKGLEVDGNGVSLIDCGLNQILKYNGSSQWACAADNSGAAAQDLQATYDNDTDGGNAIISLSLTDGGIFVRDNSTPISGNLFAIQSSDGSATYLGVTASGASIVGILDVSGLITANGGITLETGDTFTVNGEGFTDLTGTGLTLAGSSLQATLGTSIANSEIDNNAVTLSTQTTGDYVALLGTLTGLSTTGNSGEGSTPTLAVDYGSTANTAVQGNTSITVSAGTNLSGGSSITLGTGGTVTLNTVANPSFGTSVTTPLVTNAGALVLSTTGSNDLTITSGSGTVNLNASVVEATDALTYDLISAGNTGFTVTNSGSGIANLNVSEGGIQTAGSTRITNAGALQNVSADTGILTSGTLGVARGGTGVNGSSAANGNLLIGNGSGYALATLTQGSGINITNGAGSITVAATLGTSISNGEIDANAVTLSAQTSGDYVANLGSLTGLSTTGNSGEGSTPTLSVNYGSSANTAVQGNTQLTVSAGTGLSGGSTVTLGAGGTATLNVVYGSAAGTAVQGNTTLTCPSGTGNLTGGGGTITLGSGGSCGSLITNNAVSFSTSVTTPLIQNAGALTIGTTATGGADDILFNTAGGEVIRILENGDLKFEKGTNDVTFAVATPGAAATYTFSGATGTVLSSANYSGTLDSAYVNVGEAPAAADIGGSFSGGLTINDDAVTTAKILNANVTNAKLANSSLTVTAGTGLSGGGSVVLGASTSLSVQYGSAAGTAVQGNTTLTCPSGTGNLTGGGGTITLGSGGSCGSLITNNAVSFSTSVTTPLLTNAGALIVSTTGLNDLSLTSGSNTVNVNATTLRTTGSLSVDMNNGSNDNLTVTNSGSGVAALSVEGGITAGNTLTVSTGGVSITGNSTITGTLSGLTGLTVASGGANITGDTTVNGAVIVGNTFTNTTGAIRWTGTDFQGYDGSTWVSLTGGSMGTTSGKLMSSIGVGATNVAGSTTAVLISIQPNGTAIAVPAGAGDIRMPSAGSIRACTIVSSAAVTAGTASVRFRKNGAQASATNYCQLSTTNTRTNSSELGSTDITFAAGDTIGAQLVTASMTPSGSLDFNVIITVEFGSATAGTAFTNGGNSFAANASLGTADNFGLNIMTNNTTVLNLATSGLATFNGDVTTNGVLTVNSGGVNITGGLDNNSGGITEAGSITGVGANVTGTGALTVASGGSGNLTLDSASNILGIAANDTTLQRTAAGTFTIDLSNNSVTTLAIDNSTVGSTNLNLVDGELQTAGTTRLTNGGALQNITGLTISSGGATVNGTATLNDNVAVGSSSADRLIVNSQLMGSTPLVFQGATDNGFTTSLLVTDPTANNSITLPNASGTLVLDSRTIQTAANSGLSGGGNLSSDRSLSLDINNLNAITTTSNTDYLAVYDSNTASVKKVSRSDFLQGIIGALVYKGTWNAATNTPVLSDVTGSSGEEYVVSVGGTRDLGSGNITFSSGDFIIHNGTRWEVAPSSSDVSQVFGRTGNVTAQSGDYVAAQITNTPAGTLAANNVQAALNELDTEKLGSLNGLTASSQSFANDTNITISSVGSTHSLGWSGQLSVARGGTGASSFATNGVIYGSGSGALQVTAAGTSGQILVANSSGVPTFVSLSGDVSVTATGLTTVNTNSVTLSADTTGNYIATLGTLTGLSTTGNTGEGSTPTLSVLYGTSASTAVQGNTNLTCPSGTGNLTGGGTSITLGSGGTCGAISIVNNPSFSSSVNTPIVISDSTLNLISGGSSDILLDSASGVLLLADDDTTLQRVAAGIYTIDLSDTANTTLAVTNSGAGTASLSVEAGASFGGNVNTTGVYQVNGTSGLASLTCGNGDYINQANVRGGIITSGTCSSIGLSDARLKENIVELDDSILERIGDVRTVNFDFKCSDAEYAGLNLSCDRQTGVIAQELAEIFPELVYQGDDGFNRVNYAGLNMYTLKAMSELVNSIKSGELGVAAAQTSSQALNLDNLEVGFLTVDRDLTVRGGLTVHGTATFAQAVRFQSTVSFDGDIIANGRIIQNVDSAGYALIKTGQQRVTVRFQKPYEIAPIINLTLGNGQFAAYSYDNVTNDSFDIVLQTPTLNDLKFSWKATAVINPITHEQP